ncbi:MAG TPA: hypothetical protein VME42_09995 [Steroidobacteraceae bacterium]|nr:hypothetical protein [Steroidobacteraceae bacterium]
MKIRTRTRKDKRNWSRGVALIGAPVALALCLGIQAASACPTLTTSILQEYMAQGQIAFALDDEGKANTPWYFDLTQVASSGAITGTMSTSPDTPNGSAPFYPVSGTASGSGSITVSFTYSTGSPDLIGFGAYYAYTGAIMFADTSCDLLIAGTYTTTTYTYEQTRFGVLPVAHTSPATPFSGKPVGYVFE